MQSGEVYVWGRNDRRGRATLGERRAGRLANRAPAATQRGAKVARCQQGQGDIGRWRRSAGSRVIARARRFQLGLGHPHTRGTPQVRSCACVLRAHGHALARACVRACVCYSAFLLSGFNATGCLFFSLCSLILSPSSPTQLPAMSFLPIHPDFCYSYIKFVPLAPSLPHQSISSQPHPPSPPSQSRSRRRKEQRSIFPVARPRHIHPRRDRLGHGSFRFTAWVGAWPLWRAITADAHWIVSFVRASLASACRCPSPARHGQEHVDGAQPASEWTRAGARRAHSASMRSATPRWPPSPAAGTIPSPPPPTVRRALKPRRSLPARLVAPSTSRKASAGACTSRLLVHLDQQRSAAGAPGTPSTPSCNGVPGVMACDRALPLPLPLPAERCCQPSGARCVFPLGPWSASWILDWGRLGRLWAGCGYCAMWMDRLHLGTLRSSQQEERGGARGLRLWAGFKAAAVVGWDRGGAFRVGGQYKGPVRRRHSVPLPRSRAVRQVQTLWQAHSGPKAQGMESERGNRAKIERSRDFIIYYNNFHSFSDFEHLQSYRFGFRFKVLVFGVKVLGYGFRY